MLNRLIAIFFLIASVNQLTGQKVCVGPLKVDVDGSETGVPLTIQSIYSNVYCQGSNEGAIELIITGGTPSYNCKWSNGAKTPAIYNLAPGTYNVTVTDATLCEMEILIDLRLMDPIKDELYLAEEANCGECYLRDGGNTMIYQDVDYMAHVLDITDQKSLGNVEVCLSMANENIEFENSIMLKRSWSIKTSDGKALMSLFFTKEELHQLMLDAGYDPETTELSEEDFTINRFIGIDPDYQEYANHKKINASNYLNYGDTDDIQIVDFRVEDMGNFNYHHFYISLEKKEILSTTEKVDLTDANIGLLSNPVPDWLEIVTKGIDTPLSGRLSIMDIGGKLIYSEKFENEFINGKKLNVKDLPSALYFIVFDFKESDEVLSLKFVKAED